MTPKPNPTFTDVRNALLTLEQPERASFVARYFQTKPGQYGTGDQFLGLSMPQQHNITRQFRNLPPDETEQLLHDPFHECRMTALLIWVYQSRKGGGLATRAELAGRYLAKRKYVNNWDLVDTSCPAIVGEYLLQTDRTILYELAEQDHLWTQRIAMVSTLAFIRKGQFSETFALAEYFISEKRHDLVNKAVGWMLREVGKRNLDALEEFLHDHIRQLPRTVLRNAIFSLSPEGKRYYLGL